MGILQNGRVSLKANMTTENKKLTIGKAMAKFQSTLEPAIKGTSQPFYGGNYADLNSVIEASKKGKEEAGIAFATVPDIITEKVKATKTTTYPDGKVEVIEKESLEIIEITRGIIMVGDQWLEGKLTVKTGSKVNDPQAMGSGLTYNRRYLQANMLNIPTADGEDDDGEATQERSNGKKGSSKASSRPRMSSAKAEPIL